jgi:GR25 family glycosyltransferase involved in LPS biosynthesis
MILDKQPKTFVIAIKGHPVSESQLKDCLHSAEKFNWKVEIFWGVNGTTLTENSWRDIEVIPLLNKPTMIRKGTWGCFFSHWMLWNKCIDINEPIIVLEHDAVIKESWRPINIDEAIIKLHRYYKQKNIKYDDNSGVWSPSTHAYCILPKHAEQLIKFARTVGGYETDRMMGDRVLKVEHLGKPSMIERQDSYSTTGNL